MRTHNKILSVVALLVATSLTGCGGGNSNNTPAASNGNGNGGNPPAQATYEVSVTNITSGQVLTPLGVVLHDAGFTAWQAGSSVSLGMEKLAEEGDATSFIDEASLNSAVVETAAGSAPFLASEIQTVSISARRTDTLELTVATMLAKTNDAFTGVTNLRIGELAQGESLSVMPHVYDAGTEDNSETVETVAAFGVGGFNADPQTTNPVVTIHPGVVTQGDGLTTSGLTEKDRWLGPAALIVVTRTQ